MKISWSFLLSVSAAVVNHLKINSKPIELQDFYFDILHAKWCFVLFWILIHRIQMFSNTKLLKINLKTVQSGSMGLLIILIIEHFLCDGNYLKKI